MCARVCCVLASRNGCHWVHRYLDEREMFWVSRKDSMRDWTTERDSIKDGIGQNFFEERKRCAHNLDIPWPGEYIYSRCERVTSLSIQPTIFILPNWATVTQIGGHVIQANNKYIDGSLVWPQGPLGYWCCCAVRVRTVVWDLIARQNTHRRGTAR